MTRINVGIDPRELPKSLLLAEHRELKRIPNCIKSGRFNLNNIPDRFCLGDGHVSFFYNKLEYLRKRYIKIYDQCIHKKCNVENYLNSFDGIDPYFFGDYQETERDRQILLKRFAEKGHVLETIE